MMNSTLDDIGIRFGTDKSSKGHDFLRHYENVFSSIKNEAFTLLEIGGLNGASLAMWKEYFPNARIICIDIDVKVKKYESDGIHVEIGNAGSPAFLEQIKKQYGPLRIIIDDGSHRWDHQRTAFQILFSAVEADGYYVVEDIHTSYESGFSGTDDFPFVEYLKLIVDYINLRGEYKKSFESRFSKQLVANAKEVDHISFVPKSCIIKKKAF
jgi:cephalosporin hydroxylase